MVAPQTASQMATGYDVQPRANTESRGAWIIASRSVLRNQFPFCPVPLSVFKRFGHRRKSPPPIVKDDIFWVAMFPYQEMRMHQKVRQQAVSETFSHTNQVVVHISGHSWVLCQELNNRALFMVQVIRSNTWIRPVHVSQNLVPITMRRI